jgi:hypothetical protein
MIPDENPIKCAQFTLVVIMDIDLSCAARSGSKKNRLFMAIIDAKARGEANRSNTQHTPDH